MNKRIEKLRKKSLEAGCSISAERALLITEFYQQNSHFSMAAPVLRGRAFRYFLENKSLYLETDELIAGERGPAPKATPTYPEICLHSLQDLQILDSRGKVSYSVSSQVLDAYRKKIIPFWTNKTIREKMFAELPEQWKNAYAAGIFTEFQEQRAPGHTAGGANIFFSGFENLLKKIKQKIAELDIFHDPQSLARKEELLGMEQAALGLLALARRYAHKLEKLAESEKSPHRRRELTEMAAVCRRVPAHKPETFREALQHYWFVHLGVICEFNTWDSFNPGRLDQHLYPFYQKDLAEGRITTEQARELLQAFWIKFNNQPAPPKVGVTAQESNTYTDFCLINLGGVTPEGYSAVNDLTYLILDVIEEMRLLQPSSMIQVSKKNPDRFIKRALKIIRTGFGQPSVFNTDGIVQQLTRQGKSLEDARAGGASGCVESGAFGREAYFLTGYFNLPKILEITLHNGTDPLSGNLIGIKTGKAEDFTDFHSLMNAFAAQVRHFADIKIRGNNLIEQIYARYMPAPYLSLLIEDCIDNARDYHAGGARYNTSYIQGVGLGSVTDSLAALRWHVFDKKNISLARIIRHLESNFQSAPQLRSDLVRNTPKYGNDNEYTDSIARNVFDIFYSAIDSRPNTRGGWHRINMLPTTVHVYFGSVLGASADGRLAHTPLSEGISPVQGADTAGPSAVIKSAAAIDHLRTGGTLLNQKFSPDLLADDRELDKLVHLIRTYFRMDGHHIQFNVVDAKTLRDAQAHPEKHRDLIVRVAGYSDYFNDLGKDLQDEIIRRTEHTTV